MQPQPGRRHPGARPTNAYNKTAMATITSPDPEQPRDDYAVRVSAVPQFIPEQSDSDAGRYIFAYTITIENVGRVAAKLVSRHWIITDARNEVQEVRGIGVIGQQPLLRPGERFEYTSGCSLPTPVGTMRGTYRMEADDGTAFDADIPEFTLAAPRVLH